MRLYTRKRKIPKGCRRLRLGETFLMGIGYYYELGSELVHWIPAESGRINRHHYPTYIKKEKQS